MRRKQERSGSSMTSNDADYAAGGIAVPLIPKVPDSVGTESVISATSDIEFYEDLISDPVLVLGVEISHLSRNGQFIICASGVFFFSLLYGYLQELLSVQVFSRRLGLYLAVVQFTGYTILAYVLRSYVYRKQSRGKKTSSKVKNPGSLCQLAVPFKLYLGLSLLRAVDLAMTNLAMQYINYPAKTLMKSSRVVFTMIFGVCITQKRYSLIDYAIVLCMVMGLAIFMHADATSSAIFQPAGVVMLTVSLMCDGAITNMSESIMNKYKVGQDEFIFRMYSIALIAITAAAAVKGDLADGMAFIAQPGTYEEQQNNVPLDERSWSCSGKITIIVLFSSMGFFGSSCATAITKNFGALSMSITSVSRKATTLFLSFLLFDNECTYQHVVGIIIFISALTTKSIRRKNKKRKSAIYRRVSSMDLELGGSGRGGKGDKIARASSAGSNESYETVDTAATQGNGNYNSRRKEVSSNRTTAKERPNASPKISRSRYHVV
mmetsp:Transcript_5133/g.14931  ORF Transcript_5133/g.14931 Transcript_5133/m.14931 type:complete len:492 (+) Transcript_5133:255-1730(+)|eukprot:CAMPEP_0172363048 /NCGR_PEP_ID=MMETSP1060-20121228/6510_1 /TAXON_ID=37318 /ORGANISM="Pseudo-nitzschia pungens, Strain cf. cingulata" /LENGTH=491 /DNA_ID=CAMNT_0013085699 /DNA_START=219 /DNA_END=1694 /DNA_ORIENTATION=-